MENSAALRIENMALAAQRDALDAKHIADKAFLTISAHEKLCSERFENIKLQMTNIPKIYDSLNVLASTVNRAVGMWMGLSGLCVLVGTLYVVLKMVKGG